MNTNHARTISLEFGRADTETRTAPAVLSTENPVDRGDYVEILSHRPGSVDLSRAPLPVIESHDRQKLPVAVVENLKVEGGKLRGIVRFGESTRARELFADVAAGIITGLSVGYRWLDFDEKDGVVTVTRWQPFELSLVSVPADETAGFYRSSPAMTQTAQTQTTTQAATDAEAIRAAGIAEERQRSADIREAVRAAGLGEAVADGFINSGAPVDEVRRECLRRLAERTSVGTVGRGPSAYSGSFYGADSGENFRAGVVDALLIRNGVHVAKPHPAAHDFARTSICSIAETCLSRAGIPYRNMTQPEMIRAAMTTTDFPNILGSTGARALGISYQEAQASFLLWTRERNVKDFRTQTLMKLSEAPGLLETPEHGEHKTGSLSEYAESAAVKTYGRILQLTRQAMVNDDLGAFLELAAAFGAAARRLEADLVYDKLVNPPTLSDGLALFHANHGNLAASGTALSTTSLSAARAAIRKQKGPNGSFLDLVPAVLIVPPELESLALQLVASEVDPGATSNAPNTANPEWIRGLQVACDPRLTSATAWFLAAAPGQIDGVVRLYIEGEARPFVEQQVDFDTDAIRLKCRIDVAAAVGDWRGLYRNAGA